jgi:hypothetical protein
MVRKNDSGRDCIDFHNFRRSASAIWCLESARVPQSEAAQGGGHERAGITFGTYNPEGMHLKPAFPRWCSNFLHCRGDSGRIVNRLIWISQCRHGEPNG